jgi:hypothetical protein
MKRLDFIKEGPGHVVITTIIPASNLVESSRRQVEGVLSLVYVLAFFVSPSLFSRCSYAFASWALVHDGDINRLSSSEDSDSLSAQFVVVWIRVNIVLGEKSGRDSDGEGAVCAVETA